MKKWLLILSVFMIFLIWQSVVLYQSMTAPIAKAKEEAIKAAKKAFELKHIDDVTYFNGKTSYQVIRAENSDGEKIILWVPEDGDGDIITRKQEQGWDEKQVLSFVQSELDVNKLKAIRLGIKNHTPVWEITFIDDEKRYNFFYLTFNGDTWVENYRLKTT